MYHYLMHYKGKYRVKAEYDQNTNDVPREPSGDIADGYDDLYIDCKSGGKIYAYGHDGGKNVWLVAYIPSLQRGRNIRQKVENAGIEIKNYHQYDSEVEFWFKAVDIDPVAEIMGAKVSGANISPFSTRNLPKSDVVIPEEKMAEYRAILNQIPKGDLLSVSRITNDFCLKKLEKSLRRGDKKFSYVADMRAMKLGRQIKEYIYQKGFWDEYVKYFQKEINKKKGD